MDQSILKVLIVGLDNSGKTSILNTLEQKFARFHALKPTVSFEIRDEFSILGLPIKIWDLGGQKQYRDEYLSKKGFIFGETNLIFFVIDVQDPKRYSESFDYFEKAIDFLIKLGLPPKIVVLFHKVDPELKDSKKIRKNLSILKSYFDNLPSLQIDFYETSIFDRENLSQAFVAGIFKTLPKTKVIQEAMNDFLKNSGSDAVVLLDENVLIIGEAYKKEETFLELCRISGPFLSNMIEKLLRYNLTPPKVLEAEMEDGWLFQKPIMVDNHRFYLIFFSKEKSLGKINKFLPRLTEDLQSLIKYVVSPI
ncbi:MAG: ADP-ribosylation factor-like protein [Candidatus Helarchaeota archaeon]